MRSGLYFPEVFPFSQSAMLHECKEVRVIFQNKIKLTMNITKLQMQTEHKRDLKEKHTCITSQPIYAGKHKCFSSQAKNFASFERYGHVSYELLAS